MFAQKYNEESASNSDEEVNNNNNNKNFGVKYLKKIIEEIVCINLLK